MKTTTTSPRTLRNTRTLTDTEIATLQQEAAQAGDDATVALCETALQAGSGIGATELEARRARETLAEALPEGEDPEMLCTCDVPNQVQCDVHGPHE